MLELAGLRTVGDLRSANLDDVSDNGPMKSIWKAIEDLKVRGNTGTRNWNRIGLAVHNAILRVKEAEPALNIPEFFKCPISLDWMSDPVIAVPTGVSYERAHIMRWLNANPTRQDPMGGGPVERLVPNRALKEAIEHYRPLVEQFLIMSWII